MKNHSPTHDEISQRAREIWAERGRPEGRDNEIWLEAERQISMPAEAANSPSRVQGRGNGNSQQTEPSLAGADPDPTAEKSPAEHGATARGVEGADAKAAKQKKDARAPMAPAKTAPRAVPPQSGKPIWDLPHSS